MTDRETLYEGLSRAAWGYFFLHVDFNLGTVSVLPEFVGYLMLLSAIAKLSGERRDLALLRPLCVLLGAYSGIDWLLSWAGASVEGLLPPVDLVVEAGSLYFHFQFLTDMAALAETYQPEGSDLDQRLRRRRAAYTVLCTVMSLCPRMLAGRWEEAWAYVMMGLVAVTIVVMFFIMAGLFELRRCFREEENQSEI